MANQSKSPLHLGGDMYDQFCKPPDAVIPRLQTLVSHSGTETLQRVAEQWGISEQHASKSVGALADTPRSSVHHVASWGFLLRTAQIAAFSDMSLRAVLAPTHDTSKEPQVLVGTTIHSIGQRALSLLDGLHSEEYRTWDKDILNRVAELSIKPYDFARIITKYTQLSGSEELAQKISANSLLGGLYRVCTAAAVVGHELQVEFAPFEQR